MIRISAAARLHRSRHLLVPGALALVLLACALSAGPRLATGEGLAGAILVIVPLVLATLAMMPVALVGHGIDLSVGPLIGFVNVTLVAWLVAHGHDSPVEVFGYAIAAAVGYQMLQAVAIVTARVAPIVVTLAGYLVLSGLNLEIMDRPSGVAPDWMADWGRGVDVLTPVFAMLLLALVLWTALMRTAFFDHLRLTGADLRTAYVSGVPTGAVRVGAHALAGLFAGLAGIAHTAMIGSGDPTQGSTYTLSAATALVLGGTSLGGGRGGATGAVIGAVTMYLITYVLATFSFGMISGFVTQALFGIVLVVSLIVNGAMFRGRAA